MQDVKQNSRLLICFIGQHGSGKTTHALALRKALLAKGLGCKYLRLEYTFTKFLPKKVREEAKNVAPLVVPHLTQIEKGKGNSGLVKLLVQVFLLMDCYITYFIKITPLDARFVVICDRYFFEWFNYYGKIEERHFLPLIPKPDLAFLLDLPAAIAASRATLSEDKLIPLSSFYLERQNLLNLAYRMKFIIVNSTSDCESLKKFIVDCVIDLLRRL
jgi:thymidylate kinase